MQIDCVDNSLRDLHNCSYHTKPDSIIVLIFIQNISKFFTSLSPRRLSFKKFGLFLGTVSRYRSLDVSSYGHS